MCGADPVEPRGLSRRFTETAAELLVLTPDHDGFSVTGVSADQLRDLIATGLAWIAPRALRTVAAMPPGDMFSFYGLDPAEARLFLPSVALFNFGTGDPAWLIPVSRHRQGELAHLIADIVGPPMDEKILSWMSEPIQLSNVTRIAARQLSRERKY